MSKPKFTEGPWKAHGTQDIDWVETEWKGHNGPANETRETTEYICKCGKSNGFHNSFLIAAAPELYDMLQKILDEHIIPTYKAQMAQDVIRILKKARGEQ